MKIVTCFDNNGNEFYYSVEMADDVFVDVKRIGNLYYVMDCEDGCRAYNSDGNSFDYRFNESEVVNFVKNITGGT